VEAQDIVIVGAGSAGLATAALLRQLASIRSCLRRAPSMALPGGAGMGRLAPPVGADRGGAAIPLHDSNPAVYIADVVEQAADGQVAVQLARDLRPDLVVMDITMPRMGSRRRERFSTFIRARALCSSQVQRPRRSCQKRPRMAS
jgi:CheY-like chemotaxis protein